MIAGGQAAETIHNDTRRSYHDSEDNPQQEPVGGVAADAATQQHAADDPREPASDEGNTRGRVTPGRPEKVRQNGEQRGSKQRRAE